MDDSFDALLEGEFDLDIPNFEKWNHPRKQKGEIRENQKRDWINLSVDYWLDSKMHDLTLAQQTLYLRLLCVRGACGRSIAAVNLPWLQRRVGEKHLSCRRELPKLLKLGLVIATKEKKRKEKKEEERDFSESGAIPELRGIDDECLSQITPSAQKSWIKEFGVETIRAILPTAYSVWLKEKPTSKYGEPVKLGLYLKRCLENEKKYGGGAKPGGLTLEELKEFDKTLGGNGDARSVPGADREATE